MPTYQNATPPSSLFSGDVGFSFNKAARRPRPAIPPKKKLWKSQRFRLASRRISYIMLTTKSATARRPQPDSRKGFDKIRGPLCPATVPFCAEVGLRE
jgi:hypothetical protein